MAKPNLDNDLWSVIEPLPPPPKPRLLKYPGRKPLDRRKVLTGILFVLQTGIPWKHLPLEMGCGFGMSCWRHLNAWQKAGVWVKVHKALLDRVRAEEGIDLSVAIVDSLRVRAVGGGESPRPSPVDRRKNGCKHHVLTDAEGVPLAVRLTGGNRHDVTQLIPLVGANPPLAGKVGRPIRRPQELFADRAYHSRPHQEQLRDRGILPAIAEWYADHGSGLGIFRWMVERTISWLHQFP